MFEPDQRSAALEHLRALDEATLRANVLLPLYMAAGFTNVIETHGPDEFGKDILFQGTDMLAETTYLASLVKAEPIHGTTSRSGNVSEVLSQAREAFDVPFKDRTDSFVPKHISMLYVVTSHTITGKAREYISQSLGKGGLFAAIRFHDGDRILNLLEQHCPSLVESWLKASYTASFVPTHSGASDRYPVLPVWIRKAGEAKVVQLLADFDTGAMTSYLSAEFATSAGLRLASRPAFSGQTGTFLGKEYSFATTRIDLSLDGNNYSTSPVTLVRDWDTSPFKMANPNRVMLLGRDFPRLLQAVVEVNFSQPLDGQANL